MRKAAAHHIARRVEQLGGVGQGLLTEGYRAEAVELERYLSGLGRLARELELDDAQPGTAITPMTTVTPYAGDGCDGCLAFAGEVIGKLGQVEAELITERRWTWFLVAVLVATTLALLAGGWRGLVFGGVAALGGRAAAAGQQTARSGDAEAEGVEAARKGRPRAANPYAFDSQAWARTPVDAKGRPYSRELDDAWDRGWNTVPNAAAGVVVQARTWSKGSARGAGPTQSSGAVRVRTAVSTEYRRGCSAGHNATWMVTCSNCGVTECAGPCHPRHVCGGAA